MMLEHFPDELGIDSALWTRRAVGALIEQEYGVKMPIRTVGEYLKRWGYTPPKLQRACLRARPQSGSTLA
jgi:transposase